MILPSFPDEVWERIGSFLCPKTILNVGIAFPQRFNNDTGISSSSIGLVLGNVPPSSTIRRKIRENVIACEEYHPLLPVSDTEIDRSTLDALMMASYITELEKITLSQQLNNKRKAKAETGATTVESDNMLVLPPNQTNPPLIFHMLSKNLAINLEKVLLNNLLPPTNLYEHLVQPSLSSDDILKSFQRLCRSAPLNSVVVSGGAMVKTVLGGAPHWSGDVDIFCSSSSAPLVRKWLVKDLSKILVGVKTKYTQRYSINHVDMFINHVEMYSPTPRDGRHLNLSYNFSYEMAQNNKTEFKDSNGDPIDITAADGIKVPIDQGLSELEIKHLNIDVVVLKPGVNAATSILKSFDLEICMNMHNGTAFVLPNLPDSISKKTRINSNLINKITLLYIKHLHSVSQMTLLDVILVCRKETAREFLCDEWGLEGSVQRCLHSVYDSSNIFEEVFDDDVAERLLLDTFKERYYNVNCPMCKWIFGKDVRCTAKMDQEMEDDLKYDLSSVTCVIKELRFNILHHVLKCVVLDSSFKEIKRQRTSLSEIVEHTVQLTDMSTDLKVAMNFAVSYLVPHMGIFYGHSKYKTPYKSETDIDVNKGCFIIPSAEPSQYFIVMNGNLWKTSTYNLKVTFLRSALFWIADRCYDSILQDKKLHDLKRPDKNDNLVPTDDALSASSFSSWVKKTRQLNPVKGDGPIKVLSMHNGLMRNARRWMKYKERGVDLGINQLMDDQMWSIYARKLTCEIDDDDSDYHSDLDYWSGGDNW